MCNLQPQVVATPGEVTEALRAWVDGEVEAEPDWFWMGGIEEWLLRLLAMWAGGA